MNDRNGRFDTIYTGKPNNVRHLVNTVNSAQFGIENVTPCMGISGHIVKHGVEWSGVEWSGFVKHGVDL